MDLIFYVVCALLLISILINIILIIKLIKLKKEKVKETYDARSLLHDLTRGAALVRVIPIDPAGLLYRSPRDQL